MEVYVEPAVARAECGSGVRLLNNVKQLISGGKKNMWVFSSSDGMVGLFISAADLVRNKQGMQSWA